MGPILSCLIPVDGKAVLDLGLWSVSFTGQFTVTAVGGAEDLVRAEYRHPEVHDTPLVIHAGPRRLLTPREAEIIDPPAPCVACVIL